MFDPAPAACGVPSMLSPFASPVARPPSPPGLPFFGNVVPAWRDPLRFLMDARATYGDLAYFKFGPYDYYFVNDPAMIRHVLVDNAKAYVKSRNYRGLKAVFGDGLLTNEGDSWRRQRRLVQPAFHRDRLDGFARDMTRATREMLKRWATAPDATFCVHEEMMRLTLRIVGLTLFSSDIDGDARDVGEALDVALRWADDYAESLFHVPTFVPTPANVRFKRAKSRLDAIVYRLIDEHRRSDKQDLLGMLMAATDEHGVKMSDRQLRDEAMTMVLAGHETTANLLAWTFNLLSKHPDIERRVREEAVRVLGDGEPGLEDAMRLDYTRMVLEEALRLYPPAWAFERENLTDDTLGGYRIPAGSIVGISPFVLHRHPSLWENPEGFEPERFRDKNAARRRYDYLPFGGGPRTCIGNQFAMIEAQITLAMVVREFRLELDPAHAVELDPVITLRPKNGVRVRRRRAEAPNPS